MLKLIQNEWMKLWSKKTSWIMAALLVVILFASMGITKWVNSSMMVNEEETWQEVAANQQANAEAMLMDPNLSGQQKDYYEGQAAIAEYRLANEVPAFEYTSMQQQVIDAHAMLSLVTLFTVIIAAGIVASEFSQGTIKMLLTRPVKRWKILTSKYITTMIYAILLSILTIAVSALAGLIFFGIGDGTFLVWNGSEVVEGSYWIEALKMAALSFASVWIIGTFAFMLGTVFRSSSLAIGLSIFLMFTGIQAVYLLANYEVVKYYLFTHTDLTQFYTGFMPVPDITMTMSLIVLAVYFLIFMAVSYWTFSRRDVTA
ncbi:ABC transporter permease [Planococcus sp. 107-1]|uniref:ABC transporter permease n=1 Tax=Planococcus sp. 107-1 TaxID=2908840 RepID=UPI001F3B1F90|nr:ABC transporter permease [Planococcus sp. 107-1]UJF27342.1 ABC transporter permease [Planococcus sp. 107-1]